MHEKLGNDLVAPSMEWGQFVATQNAHASSFVQCYGVVPSVKVDPRRCPGRLPDFSVCATAGTHLTTSEQCTQRLEHTSLHSLTRFSLASTCYQKIGTPTNYVNHDGRHSRAGMGSSILNNVQKSVTKELRLWCSTITSL